MCLKFYIYIKSNDIIVIYDPQILLNTYSSHITKTPCKEKETKREYVQIQQCTVQN